VDSETRHCLVNVSNPPSPPSSNNTAPTFGSHPSAQDIKNYREQQKRDFESGISSPNYPPSKPVMEDRVFGSRMHALMIVSDK